MTGKEIKLKIDKLGVTQVKLAELMAVKPQTVNAILTAKDVRSGTIERIAHVLNVPVSFMYGEGDNPIAQQATVNGDFSAASVHGDATVGTTTDAVILQERIKSMQELLNEKERLIKVLMEKK